MRGLAGKVVIVAGAGSGIGAATAVRLAEEGASVVVGDLDAANAAWWRQASPTPVVRPSPSPFDIADEASVDDLVRRTVDAYGRVNGVHVNAADLSPATLERDGDADTCRSRSSTAPSP